MKRHGHIPDLHQLHAQDRNGPFYMYAKTPLPSARPLFTSHRSCPLRLIDSFPDCTLDFASSKLVPSRNEPGTITMRARAPPGSNDRQRCNYQPPEASFSAVALGSADQSPEAGSADQSRAVCQLFFLRDLLSVQRRTSVPSFCLSLLRRSIPLSPVPSASFPLPPDPISHPQHDK